MALDPRVAQRGIFITAEGEDGLVHLLGVEDLEAHEQGEVIYRQTGDRLKQPRLNLGDHVLQRVLPEIGQIHEGRNARGELDELLLYELAPGLELLLLIR